jgi:hypothetical protein
MLSIVVLQWTLTLSRRPQILLRFERSTNAIVPLPSDELMLVDLLRYRRKHGGNRERVGPHLRKHGADQKDG